MTDEERANYKTALDVMRGAMDALLAPFRPDAEDSAGALAKVAEHQDDAAAAQVAWLAWESEVRMSRKGMH